MGAILMGDGSNGREGLMGEGPKTITVKSKFLK